MDIMTSVSIRCEIKDIIAFLDCRKAKNFVVNPFTNTINIEWTYNESDPDKQEKIDEVKDTLDRTTKGRYTEYTYDLDGNKCIYYTEKDYIG